MRQSDYVEVLGPNPDLPVRRSIPPFTFRRLIKAYRGLFCFQMPGVRCGPESTTWSRELGQEEAFALGASLHGVSVGFSKKHTWRETISWTIKAFDSATPVWCHPKSELHVYESRSLIKGYRHSRKLKTFHEADPGYLFGNFVRGDPDCNGGGSGSASDDPPPGPRELPGESPAHCTQLVEPASFSLRGSEPEYEDAATVAAGAAAMFEADLTPTIEIENLGTHSYSAGVVGLDGTVAWFVDDGRAPERPANLTLVTADCLARERGFLSLSEIDRAHPVPLLAFASGMAAVRADVGVVAGSEHGSGEVWSGEAVVRSDSLDLPGITEDVVLTTFWGEADLSGLPAGVDGLVYGRAYDAQDEVVGELVIPFSTHEEPTKVLAKERVYAQA